ncbi:MAG: hypothetical protein MZV64_71315 [Ignavibacteriales bacterium]|nr:hypothetical protein [Ignavibacteriales bacterium]
MIRRLTFEGSNNTSPVWSPKGDHRLCESHRREKADLRHETRRKRCRPPDRPGQQRGPHLLP